ncbi:hypothetical protein DSO57_1017519 [Entomophthora muscae]|uniref:Uncharacterized protein n=1 Tax=Entomophthora muscae TaxID=34485 RepID=A0ACC2T4P5_9FUNG|nr:hypothetical protein DSO57_1017519 [Entomophthora muscae]
MSKPLAGYVAQYNFQIPTGFEFRLEKPPCASGTFLSSAYLWIYPLLLVPKNVGSSSQVCGVHSVPSSSPYLVYFSYPMYQVGDNPSQLLHLAVDLPSRAQDLLTSGEYLVKSLTCENLDLFSLDLPPGASHNEDTHVLVPPVEDPQPAFSTVPAPQGYSPQCTPWLLAGMALIGFNSYFPQLSPMSSLWTLVRAAISAMHQMASWQISSGMSQTWLV